MPRQPWRSGTRQAVRWTSVGDVPAVDVTLMRGGSVVALLAYDVPNSGECEVQIPAGVRYGNYILQVRSTTGEHVKADSSIKVVHTFGEKF